LYFSFVQAKPKTSNSQGIYSSILTHTKGVEVRILKCKAITWQPYGLFVEWWAVYDFVN